RRVRPVIHRPRTKLRTTQAETVKQAHGVSGSRLRAHDSGLTTQGSRLRARELPPRGKYESRSQETSGVRNGRRLSCESVHPDKIIAARRALRLSDSIAEGSDISGSQHRRRMRSLLTAGVWGLLEYRNWVCCRIALPLAAGVSTAADTGE